MNYEEAISYIEKVSCSGIMPGLVRIQALLEKTGMLQRQQLNMAQTAQSLLKALSLKVTMQMQLQML